MGFLSLYCGDGHAAEELAQEAMVRACRDWHKVRKMERPVAWCQRVGMNLANSRYRRVAAERRAYRRIQSERVATSDPAESIAVRQSLAALPRRQRAVLLLRYFDDLTYPQIAETLDLPVPTVKSLGRRGIERLRDSGDFDLSEALLA